MNDLATASAALPFGNDGFNNASRQSFGTSLGTTALSGDSLPAASHILLTPAADSAWLDPKVSGHLSDWPMAIHYQADCFHTNFGHMRILSV